MIDHLSVPVRDITRTAEFYDTVLAPIGATRIMEVGGCVAFGTTEPTLWFVPWPGLTTMPELHLALTAPSRDAVLAFFEAAVAAGAEVLHSPRVWPEYHQHYFGAFVRDPDGHNLEAVCQQPQ